MQVGDAKRTDQAASATSARGAVRPLSGVRILVVDDNAAVRRVIARVLAQAGAIVAEAPLAEAGFEAVRDFRPQLLISDIDMPIEDGYSLMRRVRALDQDSGGLIPAVALTGAADITGRAEAIRAGFTRYLGKPFVPVELVATLVAIMTIQ